MLMLKQLSIQCIRNVLNYDLLFKISNVGFCYFLKNSQLFFNYSDQHVGDNVCSWKLEFFVAF